MFAEQPRTLPPAAYVDQGGARYTLQGHYCSRPRTGDHEVRMELWRFDLQFAEDAVPGGSRCVARIYCIVEVPLPGQAACFCDVWVERAADQPLVSEFMIDRAIEAVRAHAGELAISGIAKVDLGSTPADRPHRSYVNFRVAAGAGLGAAAGLRPAAPPT